MVSQLPPKMNGSDVDSSGSTTSSTTSSNTALSAAFAALQAAEGCAAQGLWQDAIAHCRRSLKQVETADAYKLLGNAFLYTKELRGARIAYERALKLQPDWAEVYANLGTVATQQERWLDALRLKRRALVLKPEMVEFEQNIDRLWEEIGSSQQVLESVMKVLVRIPGEFAAADHVLLGDRWLLQEKVDLAVECYRRAIDLDGNLAAAYWNLAAALKQLGDVEGAVEPYAQALKLRPEWGTAEEHCQLGNEWLQREEWEQAIGCFEGAIGQDGSFAEAHFGLGMAWQKIGKLEEAIGAYRQAVQSDASHWQAYHNWGGVLLELQRWNEAVEALRKAIELNPEYFWARQNLGDGLMRLRRWDAAVEAYEQAIKLKDDFHWSHFNSGEALTKLERWDEAIDAYRRASHIKPDLIIIHQKLGDALRRSPKQRNLTDALKSYKTAIQLAPEDLQNYHKAIETDPKKPELYAELSNILQKQGKTSEATIFVQIASELTSTLSENKDPENYLSFDEISNRKDVKSFNKLSGSRNPSFLVIDSYIPRYDRESGSRRLFELIRIFRRLNYRVIFAPDDGAYDKSYVTQLENMGIEVLHHQISHLSIEVQIQSYLDLVDCAWVCRPELMQKYSLLLQRNPKIKIIYDTVDLHHVRFKRSMEVLSSHKAMEEDLAESWIKVRDVELEMARRANLVITTTAEEKEILKSHSIDNIEVVPNIHITYENSRNDFESREGLLFIGNYNHSPNADAVKWLYESIMPLIWKEFPDIKVTLLGSDPSVEIYDLEDGRINVIGYVPDVSSYFLSHKVFVAPLRYGAGMKGKIGQSLEYCLPIVATSIAAEGVGLRDELNVLLADTPDAFAKQVLRVYKDKSLWDQLASNSHHALLPYSPRYVQEHISVLINKLLDRDKYASRNNLEKKCLVYKLNEEFLYYSLGSPSSKQIDSTGETKEALTLDAGAIYQKAIEVLENYPEIYEVDIKMERTRFLGDTSFTNQQIGEQVDLIKQNLSSEYGDNSSDGLIKELAIAKLALNELNLQIKILGSKLLLRDTLLPDLFVSNSSRGLDNLTIDAGFPLSSSQGFYHPEYDNEGMHFRWTGTAPVFYFDLLLNRVQPMALKLELIDKTPSEIIQNLRCFADETEILLKASKGQGKIHMTGILPIRQAFGYTRLSFMASKLVEASNLNINSQDSRVLGVAFSRLILCSLALDNS